MGNNSDSSVKGGGSIAKIYIIAAIVIAVIVAAVQTVLMMNYYDEAMCFYETGTPLPTLLYICVAAVLVLLLSVMLVIKKDGLPDSLPEVNRFSTFAALLTGFQMIAAVLLNVLNIVNGKYTMPSNFRIAMMALAVLAGIYFVVTAMSNAQSDRLFAFLSFFVIIWAAINLMSVYFEMNTPLNSPMRILEQMAMLSVMLYFVYEARFLLGRAMPRLYVFLACMAIIILSLSALSDVALTLTGFREAGKDTIFHMAEIAMAVYIASRAGQLAWRRWTPADKAESQLELAEDTDKDSDKE